MSTSLHVEDVMLADVARITDAPTILAVHDQAARWKNDTTDDLLYLMRQPYLDLGVTVDDLACARDAIDSLARAREWELSDDLLNGSHFPGAGSGCRGCRLHDGH